MFRDEPSISGGDSYSGLREPYNQLVEPIAIRPCIGVDKGQDGDIGSKLPGCLPEIMNFLASIRRDSRNHEF